MNCCKFCLFPLGVDLLSCFRDYTSCMISNLDSHHTEKARKLQAKIWNFDPNATSSEMPFPVTEQDAKFLRGLAKAKKLAVHAAQTMLVLGCQKLCLEQKKANVCLKNCLETCNSASEAEKSQKLVCLKPKKLAGMFHTVGDCLEHISCKAESIVKNHSLAFGEQCDVPRRKERQCLFVVAAAVPAAAMKCARGRTGTKGQMDTGTHAASEESFRSAIKSNCPRVQTSFLSVSLKPTKPRLGSWAHCAEVVLMVCPNVNFSRSLPVRNDWTRRHDNSFEAF